VSKIKNRTKVLKTQINVGRIVSEINKEHIRELIGGNYRIIYKIIFVNQVDILTIHYSSRDLTKLTIE